MNKSTTTLIFTLTLLAAVSACQADHLLDQAGRALSEGDAKRAVDIYRQAVAEDPTAEGYNNLAVALERTGQFRQAADAFQRAMRLSDHSPEIRANLWRARVRGLLDITRPYATSLFVGLLTVSFASWLGQKLMPHWQGWRLKRRLHGIRAVSLIHSVTCHDGRRQPDANAYPDSERILFKADIRLPKRDDIYPLHFTLEIVGPNGVVWQNIRQTVDSRSIGRIVVHFEVTQMAELLGNPGNWTARLVLQNIDKHLGSASFLVVSRDDLITDLVVTDTRLMAVQGNRLIPAETVLSNVKFVVPTAVIRPRSFHPSKFTDLRLRVDLVNMENREFEIYRVPFEFIDGAMELCSISRPVANAKIASKPGRWEFRLGVDSQLLAKIPFRILTIEQALEKTKIERFELAGISRGGKAFMVGNEAYVQEIKALCPMITMASELDLPRAEFRMAIGVYVDRELVCGGERRLVLDRRHVELMPGEFSLPNIPEGRNSIEVLFVVQVEGKSLGNRIVTLQANRPRFADAQGRLTEAALASEFDYTIEADRILRRAQRV